MGFVDDPTWKSSAATTKQSETKHFGVISVFIGYVNSSNEINIDVSSGNGDVKSVLPERIVWSPRGGGGEYVVHQI